MKPKIFLIGLCAGAIGMDMLNCHLYRLGSFVHWIDVLSISLWPVLLWSIYGALKIGIVESDLKEWITQREMEWEEKRIYREGQ